MGGGLPLSGFSIGYLVDFGMLLSVFEKPSTRVYVHALFQLLGPALTDISFSFFCVHATLTTV